MIRSIATLVLVVALPLLTFGVMVVAGNQVQQAWRDTLNRSFEVTLTDDQFAQVPLAEYCPPAIPSGSAAPQCEDAWGATVVGGWALVAAGLTALIVVAAAGLGRLPRRFDPAVRRFRPGARVVAAAGLVVLALDLVVVVAAVYWAPRILTGYFYPATVAIAGIASAGILLACARASWAVVRPAPIAVEGIAVAPDDRPALLEVAAEVAEAGETEPPAVVLATAEPALAVTDAELASLDGRTGARTAVVSLPLVRLLSVDELRALFTLELGRLADRGRVVRFLDAHRAASASLTALDAGRDLFVRAAMAPAVALLSVHLRSYARRAAELATEATLAADARAAELTSPGALAGALVAQAALAQSWPAVRDGIRRGQADRNLSTGLVARARQDARDGFLRPLEPRPLPHPTIRLPDVAARLAALGEEGEALATTEVLMRRLSADPGDGAAALVDDLERIELDLSEAIREVVGEPGDDGEPAAGTPSSGERDAKRPTDTVASPGPMATAETGPAREAAAGPG